MCSTNSVCLSLSGCLSLSVHFPKSFLRSLSFFILWFLVISSTVTSGKKHIALKFRNTHTPFVASYERMCCTCSPSFNVRLGIIRCPRDFTQNSPLHSIFQCVSKARRSNRSPSDDVCDARWLFLSGCVFFSLLIMQGGMFRRTKRWNVFKICFKWHFNTRKDVAEVIVYLQLVTHKLNDLINAVSLTC